MGDYLDLGSGTKAVSTNSAEAQLWFDRGFRQSQGFNHEEAIRCFSKAIELDGSCAILYFFKAWALSGNYNNPGGLDLAGAYACAAKASELIAGGARAQPWEIALVEAMSVRYAAPGASADQAQLNRNFAEAMRKVYNAFGGDLDVAALFAESLMNLNPWKLWTPLPNPTPTMPETLELIAVLEAALAADPNHPGLCHLYIHAMELSPTPAKALAAANVLRTRVPDQGHLVHMPSHIDMWVGQYKEAIECNVAGVQADEKYVSLTGNAEEFYKFYRMHNYHFVVWAAMFDGQSALALDYASRMQAQLTEPEVQFMLAGVVPMGAVYLEAFAAVKWHALVRFGLWQQILAEPVQTKAAIYPYNIATAHYARGLAFAALGQVEEAEAAKAEFDKALQNPALDGRVMHNNVVFSRTSTCGVLNVAQEMLSGEIEYRKGNKAQAFAHLREAVRRDIALVYDEPWGWMVPARHALGALLLESGEVVEAEAVFRADLSQYQDNLWGLRGLLDCLDQQHRAEEAALVRAKLATATARSDVRVEAACNCALKAGAAQPKNAPRADGLGAVLAEPLPVLTVHHKARLTGRYAGITAVSVPDDKLSWEVAWPEYNPPDFTDDVVFRHDRSVQAGLGGWADPPDYFLQAEFKSRRSSYALRFDTDGRPLNPLGRTGLKGRGVLGKWGAQQAADPIVFRQHGGKLQVVLILRQDINQWAIPGGMIDDGELFGSALRREFEEEASRAGDPKLLEDIFQGARQLVYVGYSDDPRNTDNAWIETTSAAFLLTEKQGKVINLMPTPGETMAVAWTDVDTLPQLQLFASHKKLLDTAIALVSSSFAKK